MISRRHLAVCQEKVLVVTTRQGDGAAGISWVEDKDAAKHPTMPSIAPATKDYPAPNVGSAGVKKRSYREKGGEKREGAHIPTSILVQLLWACIQSSPWPLES